MSMGGAYKFFGFSISYTTLNISLFILYLPIMLFNPCTFLPFSLFPLPTDNHPNDLYIYVSVSVLFVCLVCYLDSIIDSCEFIAILMFIVLIFFFLYNAL